MWIAGLDALRKPLLHLHTQANVDAAVGDDRHGLHEPQPGRARRPRVRLHPDPARRRRARPSPATSATRGVADADRRLGARRRRAAPSCARCGWPASATTCATSPSPRATRSRPSCASASRSTPTASTTWSTVVDAVADADVDALVAEYADALRRRPRAARRRRAARVAALRRPHRGSACARSSTDGGFTRLHHQLRGPRRAAAAARPRRAAADGRRLRLRRRGRLEDRRSCCARSRSMAAGPARRHVLHGGLHLPPGPGRGADPRRAHARGLPVHRRRHARRCEIHPLGIGGREDPVRLVFDADARARRVVARRWPTWATGSGSSPTRSTSSRPTQPLPKLPVARAVWQPAPGPAHLGRGLADRRRPAPHRAVDGAGRRAPVATSPRCPAPSWRSSTRHHDIRRFVQELRWNQAYYRLAQGF